MPAMEDYYECLHHRKEVRFRAAPRRKHAGCMLTRIAPQAARVKMLQAAYRKAEAQKLQENPPTAGQIRNLGLLDKEEDTKKVLGAS